MPAPTFDIKLIEFTAGISDFEPWGLLNFLELRSDLPTLKIAVGKKIKPAAKSKAKKGDWIAAFVGLPAVDRRQLLQENPELFWLLPKDMNALKIPRTQPVGTKSFNPGRQTVFDIYGVLDVLAVLQS